MSDEIKQSILLLISKMAGGGAERVIGILADGFAAAGWDTTLMVTSQHTNEMLGYELNENVKVESLLDYVKDDSTAEKFRYGVMMQKSRIIGTLCEKLNKKVSDKTAYETFLCQYHSLTDALRDYLKIRPDTAVISFLQPTVNATLLAAEGLPNRIIISERSDPERYNLNRYMPYFAREWYPKADKIVFQTESARDSFGDSIKSKSAVIYNPLNSSLPEPYHGEREKKIVNFCRITKEKNLPLLIDAFERFHKEYGDYILEIWGEGALEDEIRNYIIEKSLDSVVKLKPFDKTLHDTIKKYAMFASSSDYEGMSNSMLEALAIGLPAVCTDCPSGGARAIIKDHENGLLVPIKNADKLFYAMKEIAASHELAEKLSLEASKIRDELCVDTIVSKWIELTE